MGQPAIACACGWHIFTSAQQAVVSVASPPATASVVAAGVPGVAGAVVALGAAEDPKILALSHALEALDVGTAATCLKFAKALEEHGILSIDKLKKLPEADAIEVLGTAGMKKLQIRTVMEAIAPPPVTAPVVPAAAAAPKTAAVAVVAPAAVAAVAFNESPQCVATLQVHSNDINSVAFHPSAPILATGSDDSTAKLFRLNSDGSAASCVATLQGHSSSVLSVAFHASAPILATGSWDKTAKLWR